MKRFLCVLFGAMLFVSVAALGAYAVEGFATYSIPKDKVNAAGKYWTREKMKNAKPYPSTRKKGAVHRVPANTEEQLSGPPGMDPGDPGEGAPSRSAGRKGGLHGVWGPGIGADTAEMAGASTAGYNYPAPHTTFPVLDSLYGISTTPYPYRTIGKIFFTEEGEEYVCSGASIGGRAVLTAGHCVSDGAGTYHSNWIFVPSYQDGEEPYGEWTAFWLGTFREYHQEGDCGRDVGFAAVSDKNGKKLSQRVGFLGFYYNAGRIRHWNMFGYPADDPWDGEFMVETQASYAYVDDSVAPDATGIGTTQTEGCSGGPWIMKFKPGPKVAGTNFANGVNSYSNEDTGEIFSPYFDTRVKDLKDRAVAK